MKRFITLLLAVLMICALTVSAYADVIHTDASPSLPSLGSALSQGNIIIIAVIAVIVAAAVIWFIKKKKK